MHLDVQQVTKSYAGHLALDNVSLQIPENCIFGLLGPNGAGKTTLIRILTQITVPDSGRVQINNRPMQSNDIYNMGYLPEERGLYKKMKVGEQCIYLARLKGMKLGDAKRELVFWFEKFGIMHWWNKKLEELSKGMQQKVQFITTVVHKPDLLIFDEPFSGFDPINTDLIKKEILELKEKGTTILLSTHNMNSVEELCDEIALINHSKVVLEGNVFHIREKHKSKIIRLKVLPVENQAVFSGNEYYDIVSQTQKDTYMELRILNKKDCSNNELLRMLLTDFEIISYQEEVPTMNEIFIQTVSL